MFSSRGRGSSLRGIESSFRNILYSFGCDGSSFRGQKSSTRGTGFSSRDRGQCYAVIILNIILRTMTTYYDQGAPEIDRVPLEREERGLDRPRPGGDLLAGQTVAYT